MEVSRYCGRCPLRRDPTADVRGTDCSSGCKQARTEFPPFTIEEHKGRRDVQLVRLLGDPVLRTPAQPIAHLKQVPDVLVRQLFMTMRMYGGIGLAAPQIGVPLRVAVVAVDGHAWTLINPEIASASADEALGEEGCLSIPGNFGLVSRAKTIGVRTMTNEEPFRATGLTARAVQHEIDHLNGVLFIDRIKSQLNTKPGPRATTPVYWDDGDLMCPGCGWTYDVPRTTADIEVLCGSALDGCQSPILHVKGAGSWWTKQALRRTQRPMDKQLRNQWLRPR